MPARERERLECRSAQAEFTAAVERFKATQEAAITSHFVEGRPADVILEAASSTQADLIVMSTHGHAGLRRVLHGSVSDEVRRADVPVLLVPSAATHDWAAAEDATRLLVPLDGSVLAAEALGPAAELAAALGAELVLLGALEPAEPLYPDALIQVQTDLRQQRSQATAYLNGAATDLRSQLSVGVQVLVAQGRAAEAILEIADQIGAAAIVMATHGWGGLRRAMLGSVAAAAVQRAHVPVLVCRSTSVQDGAFINLRAGGGVRG